MTQPPGSHHPVHRLWQTRRLISGVVWVLAILKENIHTCTTVRFLHTHVQHSQKDRGLGRRILLLKGFSLWTKPQQTHLPLRTGSDHYQWSRASISLRLHSSGGVSISKEQFPKETSWNLGFDWTWNMTSIYTYRNESLTNARASWSSHSFRSELEMVELRSTTVSGSTNTWKEVRSKSKHLMESMAGEAWVPWSTVLSAETTTPLEVKFAENPGNSETEPPGRKMTVPAMDVRWS